MAKKVIAIVKLHCPAGQANPAPPVGPALGQHGVNIMDFCKTFNARTQDKAGLIIPAVITIYADRSFTFELKSPPAAVLLLPKPLKRTLPRLRFIALHMMPVRISPEAPTRGPETIRTVLLMMKPAAQAARSRSRAGTPTTLRSSAPAVAPRRRPRDT